MNNNILLRVILLTCGALSLIILFHLYKKEINKSGEALVNDYNGPVEGPFVGRLKFINIIVQRDLDCLKNGFYIYFQGKDRDDFVIVTDSVRASFGDISENIIGNLFKFDRLMRCRTRIENKNTYLLLVPPVMMGSDDE